jgi:transcriptional regulator with XRE-family HTH domain
MSQEDLAHKIGISRTYLSEIERGEAQNISFRVVDQLQKVLGIDKNTEEDQTDNDLPEGLSQFAEEANLPERDIKVLASIELRGKRPNSKQEWRVLYNLIRSYLESKD